MSGAGHIRNPKDLPVNLDTSETVLGKILFLKTEIGEVRQIANDGLKPAVLRHYFANPRILEFIYIECQHGDVL